MKLKKKKTKKESTEKKKKKEAHSAIQACLAMWCDHVFKRNYF
jgi:hypothetical protein